MIDCYFADSYLHQHVGMVLETQLRCSHFAMVMIYEPGVYFSSGSSFFSAEEVLALIASANVDED